MDLLYKFTLNEEIGKIDIQEIEATGHTGKYPVNKESYWKYKHNGRWVYVYETKLDRYVSGSVYSLDPSLQHARSIILRSVGNKLYAAKREYDKWQHISDLMKTVE